MKIISKSSQCCIEKEILAEGTFSNKPIERSVCTIKISDINYQGSPIKDQNIDEVLVSDYFKSPYTEKVSTIGDANSKTDEYVERIIQTMFIKEESFAKIALPPFDNTGTGSVCFDFKIKLIAFEGHKPIWEWTPKEKYDVALSYKEVGVGLYKSKRIVDAFYKFSKGCKILITLEPIGDLELEETLGKHIDNLRKVLYNNMAECHLSRKNYEHAILLCDKVLGRDENNVKALYRRAVAHENLRDYENALAYMDKVMVLEPRNFLAKERLGLYKKKVHEAQKRFDNMVKKMFHIQE